MLTIMVVEDNEPSRDALCRRLERRGYQVIPAVDGEEAVAMARSRLPNLILMDLGLPGIDGWEATRRLKGALPGSGVPNALGIHLEPASRLTDQRATQGLQLDEIIIR